MACNWFVVSAGHIVVIVCFVYVRTAQKHQNSGVIIHYHIIIITSHGENGCRPSGLWIREI